MPDPNLVERILSNAERDGIQLDSLPFIDAALQSILDIATPVAASALPDFSTASRIDTHVHPVPDWYRALSPLAAGRETPRWDVLSHLQFMADHAIRCSIVCISTPQANAFPGDVEKTKALARILNEFVAALVQTYPERFSFLAVTPLPYVREAIKEVVYALDELGAVGVGILTNHDGQYPEHFVQLWRVLNARNSDREIVFIHPTDPVIRVQGTLVSSKPSPLRAGLGEFYFETARAISSITSAGIIHDFPKLHWRISHGAGAFPCIADRFLLGFPELADKAREIYATRFWYDSAGPVYPRQIKGLLAYDIPASQLVFGTDYPYGIGFWDVNKNIEGLSNAEFLHQTDKNAIFSRNAQELWKGKIKEP